MSNAYKCDYDILTANDDGKRTTAPRLIYIHTFEGRDLTAQQMATYQLSPAAGGSYTLVIDADGKTARENDDEFIPWAAGWTANRNGHHVSLAGQAAFTREKWLSRTAQMDKLVEVIAAYCRRYGYPPIIRYAGDLKAGKWGISTHDAAAKAWRETDHHDPGVNFPLDVIASRVAAALKQPASPPPPTPPTAPAPEVVAGTKYPSYIDGRELRFSEYIRHIDYKITKLFEEVVAAHGEYPSGIDPDHFAGVAGERYPSFVDPDISLTLDQFIRFIDYKLDFIYRKEIGK